MLQPLCSACLRCCPQPCLLRSSLSSSLSSSSLLQLVPCRLKLLLEAHQPQVLSLKLGQLCMLLCELLLQALLVLPERSKWPCGNAAPAAAVAASSSCM
jgi:hypothetical protein